MVDAARIRRLLDTFIIGFLTAMIGFLLTGPYLRLIWSFTDPRWGLPFLWFIPHGIEGLHFHHDIEFFIITPMMALLARRGLVSRNIAFVVCAFFLGMAIHHWWTEGLVLVSFGR